MQSLAKSGMLYEVEIWGRSKRLLRTTTGKIRENGYGNQQEYASIHLENGSRIQRNGSTTVEKSSHEKE